MYARDSRLTPDKYALLKTKIYKIYLSDIEEPGKNKISRLYTVLEDCGIPCVMEILDDTIEFPYDKELADFFNRNRKMTAHDLISTASNLYGIDDKLVISKLREYLYYDFIKLLDENKIDQDAVNELSELYLDKNKEKNQK